MSSSTPLLFSFGVRLGLVFIVQSASLSAAAVLYLLGSIAHSAVTSSPTRTWHTVTHVHWYFLSLLVSEVIQAIGGIMSVRWIADATVHQGSLCTAQAIFKQLGDVGVALASLAIAVHTFCVLVLRWRPNPSPMTAFVVLALIWTFLALVIGISAATHKGKDYWGVTQYWCWITSDFLFEGIFLEYFWMWLTAFLSIALYVPIALVIKGYIIVDGFRIAFASRKDRNSMAFSIPQHARGADDIAKQMLFYPAIYITTVLPIAIVRFLAFRSGESTVPYPATVFADVLFASSGLFNVLLFTATRPSLVPHRDASGPYTTTHSTSFSTQLNPKSPRTPSSQHRFSVFSDRTRGGTGDLRLSPVMVPARTLSISGRDDVSGTDRMQYDENEDSWLPEGRLSTDKDTV